jgi:hypothetical protein
METERTPSGPGKEAETSSPSPKPGHPRAVVALLIAATLLTVVAIFSIWINRQALNTDNWVDTSARLLQNKEIQGQLAIYMSDQLFETSTSKKNSRRPCRRDWRRLPVPLRELWSSWGRRPPKRRWKGRRFRNSGKARTAPPMKPC